MVAGSGMAGAVARTHILKRAAALLLRLSAPPPQPRQAAREDAWRAARLSVPREARCLAVRRAIRVQPFASRTRSVAARVHAALLLNATYLPRRGNASAASVAAITLYQSSPVTRSLPSEEQAVPFPPDPATHSMPPLLTPINHNNPSSRDNHVMAPGQGPNNKDKPVTNRHRSHD
jgi:hypothetical protein